MGLSKPFPSGDGGWETSIFDQMVKNKLLTDNLFTFYLRRNQAQSKITFGGYEPSLIKGDIQWFPVIHDSYWMIPMNKIFLNDKDSGICNNDCAAIMDSGTSLITAPENDLYVLSRKFRSK